jgi:hypothetical protein
MSQFNFIDEQQVEHMVEWNDAGLTIVLDTMQLTQQLVPASALPFFNASVIAGHDTSFQVTALQADKVTPFNLTGIPINFYGKINQSDTTFVFFKTLPSNADIIVSTPTNGLIIVFVRAADYAALVVGTTIFLYVDVVNSAGNPVNISKWTLTITN